PFDFHSGQAFAQHDTRMKTPELPQFEHKPKNYSGPSADDVLRLRKEFLNPGIFLYYKKPIMLVEGKMQYLWDEQAADISTRLAESSPSAWDIVTRMLSMLCDSKTKRSNIRPQFICIRTCCVHCRINSRRGRLHRFS